MVPPFLAYYGAITQNRTILEASYTQIKLYRTYLRDPTSNMWKHVLLGTSGNDDGCWSTGDNVVDKKKFALTYPQETDGQRPGCSVFLPPFVNRNMQIR